ncbi:MAG: tetratricopeptide (TPR) repeat protein [Nitrospinales bacterium]|jgi:tetratricopeptide (TPR) repeat protein
MISKFTDPPSTQAQKLYCCMALALVGILVYGNHLQNTFQFDSVAYIKNSLSLKNPESMLTLQFWMAGFFSRGLLSISMALNAHLDELHPFGYHILNLALHIFNAILIFHIFKKALLHFKNKIGGNDTAISFFAATIFLVHPIQTESVIYIISRSEVLASTFYLLGFFLFQICLDLDKRNSLLNKSILPLVILLLAVIGFSVKQTLATFPLIIFLYYISVCPLDSPVIKFLLNWKWPILTAVLIFSSLLLYKLLSDETFLIGPSNPLEMVGREKYMLSQPAVIVFYYLHKILFPINLNVDPDIEVVTHLFSFSFIASMTMIAFIAYYFSKQKAWRFYIFFLSWFFIILSPSSSIVTLHDLAAEHRVYLALPGVIFIFSYGLFDILKNQKSGILILCGLTLFLGALNIERNMTWKNELSLWQDTYKKSPGKLRPLINLARAHSIEGNSEDAVQYYEEALLKGSGVFVIQYNLGELYLKKGRVEEAILRFESALQLKPEIPESYAKLGEIYLSQKKWKLADIYFKKCIEIDSRFSHVFKNLGVLHFYHLKNLKESLLYFSRSLALDPNQIEANEIKKLLQQYSTS